MIPPQNCSLDQLRPGEIAWVTHIDGTDDLSQRLGDLGLQKGVEVELLGRAPWGDPLRLRVGNWRLGLRRQEAARIHLQKTSIH